MLFLLRKLPVFLCCAFLLGGCASQPAADDIAARDPLEGFDRQVFVFNDRTDRNVLEPVAKGYRAALPDAVRTGIHNVLSTLGEPKNAINSLLQADLRNFGNAVTRFVVNIAFGYGGVVDRAGKEGVVVNREDFGQTLAVWGVPAGPYLMLPLLGPSDARDFVGKVVDTALLDPIGMHLATTDLEYLTYVERGIYVVDKRSMLIEAVDEVRRTSVDLYAKVRDIYWQDQARNLGLNGTNNAKTSQEFDQYFGEEE